MLVRARVAMPVALAATLLLPAAPASADDDDDGRRRGHGRDHRRHGDGHHGGRHGGHNDGHHGGHHGGHHDRHSYKHYGGGHRHHHGCGHGGWYGPRRVVVKNHYHGYPVYDHGYGYGGPAPYYCGPCSHYFDSYDHLSHHVHRHHQVAVLELPFVIFQTSIGGGVGWVFGH